MVSVAAADVLSETKTTFSDSKAPQLLFLRRIVANNCILHRQEVAGYSEAKLAVAKTVGPLSVAGAPNRVFSLRPI